jgi:transglutaminase-like putative cysteine protease
MIRRLAAIHTLLIVVAAAAAQDRGDPARRPATAAPVPASAPETNRRAGDFRTECTIAVPDGAQVLDLWVPAPRVDEFQTVLSCIAPSPTGGMDYPVLTQHTDPESGNTFLHVRANAPRGTIGFHATWALERREAVRTPFRRRATREGEIEAAMRALVRDLAPTTLVPVDGRMKTRANMIAPEDSDPLNVARAIYDEVLRTVAHSTKGEGWGRGDALWALDAGYGDATDATALFVGLARARGIPARFHTGVALPEGRGPAEVEIPLHTAWAEFFVADLGWIPVDLDGSRLRPETRQYNFGSLDERRIQLGTGRDVSLAPPARQGPRNFVLLPYAEVDGEPTAVVHRFTFKEK